MIDEFGGDFIQWLRGFYHVAKTGSVTLASKEMGRNQPAISHQIKCLENEIGAILFDRSTGKMELTPEGKEVFDKSLSIFELVKQMKAEINEKNNRISGEINIVTTHAVIHYYLAEHIVEFNKHYPEVHFHLSGGNFEFILDQVESSSVDFGIAYVKAVNDEEVFHKLFDSAPVLITPKRGPYCIDKITGLKQLSGYPFILFSNVATLVKSIKKLFNQRNLSINVILVLNNVDIIKKYVELGMGISILEGFAIEDKEKEKLNIYSLDDYFERRAYGLVIRKRKYLSPSVKMFLKHLKNQL